MSSACESLGISKHYADVTCQQYARRFKNDIYFCFCNSLSILVIIDGDEHIKPTWSVLLQPLGYYHMTVVQS